MHTEILRQLGLPKNEARIYEALVGLGPANISEISGFSKVNRRNVYDSIENLLAKKLVSPITGYREKRYQAADPNILRELLIKQQDGLKSILPKLNNLYKTKIPDEQAFISRGTEGIKNFWNYVQMQNGPVYFVGGKGAWHDQQIENERKRYFTSCNDKGIIIKGIFDYEMRERGKDVYSEYELEKIRFIPKEYSTKATFDVCGDRVIMFAMPKERNVFNATIFNVVSKSLANSFRTWFELLWKKSETL
ncbi:MAG: helix-turn-helix domain-containing protein [bacterium]